MRLLRPSLLYGKHGRLGVGRTKFFEDYVHRNDGAVEQFIAGTSVRRLKLLKIGQRAVAAISDEVDQLIEALRAERRCAVKTSARLLPRGNEVSFPCARPQEVPDCDARP